MYQRSPEPFSTEMIYVIVWEKHCAPHTRGLVYEFRSMPDQSLEDVRDEVKREVTANLGLSVNFSGKSWYTVSEECAEKFEYTDTKTIGNARFVLVSHCSKVNVHLPVGHILYEKLFEHYFG